jgi:hypothetical protein
MEQGRFHGVPVTEIEPGEQFSGFRVLDLFHARPVKSRRLVAAGYRHARRASALRQCRERAARNAVGPTSARSEQVAERR